MCDLRGDLEDLKNEATVAETAGCPEWAATIHRVLAHVEAADAAIVKAIVDLRNNVWPGTVADDLTFRCPRLGFKGEDHA